MSETSSVGPRFVSTFLSHSSVDKQLVTAVAEQLGRRGVLAWLDKDELSLGPLDTALKEAIRRQATLVVFLSEAAIASEWCKDELRWALEAGMGDDDILPVYLGDPLKLVTKHPLLRKRFLLADGDRVKQLGVPVDMRQPDPAAIAEGLSKAAFRRTIPQTWTDVAIYLDHRGEGNRCGRSDIPANVASLELPVLTFRTSRGRRQKLETLSIAEWNEITKCLEWTLATALGTVRGDQRKVRVLGNAQSSLWWCVGQHFDRTTSVELYGYGRPGEIVTNKHQERCAPLAGGDPRSAALISGTLDATCAETAIGVGRKGSYVVDAQGFIPTSVPLLWLEVDIIEDTAQAMKLVADLVAVVQRVRQEFGVERVLLFWTTAAHVALLAAANLTPHVISRLNYMERDHERGTYIQLEMP